MVDFADSPASAHNAALSEDFSGQPGQWHDWFCKRHKRPPTMDERDAYLDSTYYLSEAIQNIGAEPERLIPFVAEKRDELARWFVEQHRRRGSLRQDFESWCGVHFGRVPEPVIARMLWGAICQALGLERQRPGEKPKLPKRGADGWVPAGEAGPRTMPKGEGGA